MLSLLKLNLILPCKKQAISCFYCPLAEEKKQNYSVIREDRRGKFRLAWVEPLDVRAA